MSPEADLPKILVEIARLIGLSDALKIAEKFGGTGVYVSPSPEGRHAIRNPILQLVGLDAARKLAAVFGGERVHIPRAAKLLRERAILADRPNLSVAKIALKYGLDERSVWRILAGYRERHTILAVQAPTPLPRPTQLKRPR